MCAPTRTETTVAVSDFATIGEDRGGSIRKVLNGDADAALAALLYGLEGIFESPTVSLAANQRAALLDLRKAAYGY